MVEKVMTEVLIVGGGGAGLSAAIEAAAAGREVLLIEKGEAIGGTTAWSIGSFTSSCTALQRREGITDTPEAHYEDMGKFNGERETQDNHRLRKVLADESPGTLEWLESLGVTFFGPVAEPPHRVPRMHNVLPNSKAYIYHLERRARRLGVRITTGTAATEIKMARGRAVGVRATRDGRELEILARRGIVLAGGDYAASKELKAKFGAKNVLDALPLNENATGDCQQMAMALGIPVLATPNLFGPVIRFVPPPRPPIFQIVPPWRWLMRIAAWGLRTLPTALFRPFILSFMTTALGPEFSLFTQGAALVGTDGSPIHTKAVGLGEAVSARNDNKAYILLDKTLAETFSSWPNFISTAPGVAYAYFTDYKRSRPDLVHSASRLEDLKPSAEFDGQRLAKELMENPAYLSGRPTSPFYLLGPVKAYVLVLDGGVAVNEAMQVLDSAHDPIPGLYAAGGAGQAGLLLLGHGHHISWAMVSGRLAGRSAAREKIGANG